MTVLGLGTDLVHLPEFAESLNAPGSRMIDVFTSRERRRAKQRAADMGTTEALHLAGVWAIKEAVIKAWSGGLTGARPRINRDDVDWRDVEVTHDPWGRPSATLHGAVRAEVELSLIDLSEDGSEKPPLYEFHVSVSHDGDYACATVLFQVP